MHLEICTAGWVDGGGGGFVLDWGCRTHVLSGPRQPPSVHTELLQAHRRAPGKRQQSRTPVMYFSAIQQHYRHTLVAFPF